MSTELLFLHILLSTSMNINFLISQRAAIGAHDTKHGARPCIKRRIKQLAIGAHDTRHDARPCIKRRIKHLVTGAHDTRHGARPCIKRRIKQLTNDVYSCCRYF
jgi:hypothetical protein